MNCGRRQEVCREFRAGFPRRKSRSVRPTSHKGNRRRFRRREADPAFGRYFVLPAEDRWRTAASPKAGSDENPNIPTAKSIRARKNFPIELPRNPARHNWFVRRPVFRSEAKKRSAIQEKAPVRPPWDGPEDTLDANKPRQNGSDPLCPPASVLPTWNRF